MITCADVILPVAVPKAYTFKVPEDLEAGLMVGMRVEVQFGKQKIYSGIVKKIEKRDVRDDKLKFILGRLDDQPLIHPVQMDFWVWMANYYCCTIGEVMLAALPGALKLNSETFLVYNPQHLHDPSTLSDDLYLIQEALSIQGRLRIQDIHEILQKKIIYKIIQEAVELEIAFIEEEARQTYKPRQADYVRLASQYRDPSTWNDLFALTSRSEKQTNTLLAYFQLIKSQPTLSKSMLIKQAQTDATAIKGLCDKGILEVYSLRQSRLEQQTEMKDHLLPMSAYQQKSYAHLRSELMLHQVVLLRGITGSGKTRIYQELIHEILTSGGQILYLLSEISLTSQMEIRLREQYGGRMLSYHSRLNANKRVEIWQAIYNGHQLVVGARSSLLLPFRDLRLIIIDEEHDQSYKQHEPNPRYHARDAAIYLAQQIGAKVILGTATPSIESLYMAKSGKFGYVEMLERFGKAQLPELQLVDLRKARLENRMVSIFTKDMLEEMEKTFNRHQKVILFQNRRGFSPVQECTVCHWRAECIHCDVSLTLHQKMNALKCHYCGYSTQIFTACPACGSLELQLKGFGTEKIEEEIKIYFPEAKIARMDADSVKTKIQLEQILEQFAEGQIDILVGTQMITKGLDFDDVGLVGVLSADHSLYFPDFRASERTFQLLTQVSGRSGRREEQGKVLIQSNNTEHPVIKEFLDHDLDSFYKREIHERQEFHYPPFVKLIQITLKHKEPQKLKYAADQLAISLKKTLGTRAIGPATPGVPRVRNFYLATILLKLERKQKVLDFAKSQTLIQLSALQKHKGMSGLRHVIDVDPA
jgi:primosomal protein N' (replication factor Y)